MSAERWEVRAFGGVKITGKVTPAKALDVMAEAVRTGRERTIMFVNVPWPRNLVIEVDARTVPVVVSGDPSLCTDVCNGLNNRGVTTTRRNT